MSRWLQIELSPEEATAETIRAFYEHALQKCNGGDYDPDLTADHRRYLEGDRDYEVERLEEGVEPSLKSHVPARAHSTAAWDRFVALFESDGDAAPRTVEQPGELDELVAVLREMEAELERRSREDPRADTAPEEWAIMFETSLVALAEFAREHGYGVRAPL